MKSFKRLIILFALFVSFAAVEAAPKTEHKKSAKTTATVKKLNTLKTEKAPEAETKAKDDANASATTQEQSTTQPTPTTQHPADTTIGTAEVDDELLSDVDGAESDSLLVAEAEGSGYTQLKTKFLEGGAGFMSLVAIALILGLTICIERIIYLSMSEIDAKKFMRDLEAKLNKEGVEEAKTLCRNTRGPVASICYQGLLRINESQESIERSIASYGSVQMGNMEKGCSWITLLIAMAPSLGFLGTVIGMVMAFDQIQMAGDISPTIVASGMKFALITTIFGIVTALILQLFYNYVLSKIDHLTAQMEESAITLMDILKEKNG